MTAEAIVLATEGSAYELGVCKDVGDQLERHYPGWQWMVTVPPKGGVVHIQSMHMDPKYGFIVKLTRSYSASHLAREAVRAGGELLERCNMPRNRYDYDRERSAANKNIFQFLVHQR